MTRTISAANEAALQEKLVRYALFIRIDWPTQLITIHNGYGSFVFNGETYLGIGSQGQVGLVKESLEMRPDSARFKLAGAPSNLLQEIFEQDYHRKAVNIYYSLVNERFQLVDPPFEIWTGSLNYIDVDDDGSVAEITVDCISESAEWKEPHVSRHTDAEQRRLFTGDLGHEFMHTFKHKKVLWNGAVTIPGGGGSPGPRPGQPDTPRLIP